jgi:hypothetical protein
MPICISLLLLLAYARAPGAPIDPIVADLSLALSGFSRSLQMGAQSNASLRTVHKQRATALKQELPKAGLAVISRR